MEQRSKKKVDLHANETAFGAARNLDDRSYIHMLIPDMLAQEYIHSDTRYIPLESDELMVDKLAVCTFCLYPWCYFFFACTSSRESIFLVLKNEKEKESSCSLYLSRYGFLVCFQLISYLSAHY